MAGRYRVYLAGPIQHADDNGHGWRDHVAETVDAFEWVNPLDHAEPTDTEYQEGDYDIGELVEEDKRLIDEADAVLVGWRRVPSVGTPMEILYAYDRGIPVVVWFEPEGSTEMLEERKLSPWLRYHADHVGLSLSECVDALGEFVPAETKTARLFDRQDRETFREAVEAWGVDAQSDMAVEELGEAIQELAGAIVTLQHLKRDRVDWADVHEELADIRIMWEQLRWYFGPEYVDQRVVEKMDRLWERLAAEGVSV